MRREVHAGDGYNLLKDTTRRADIIVHGDGWGRGGVQDRGVFNVLG